jgi:hypothetical protein
VKFDFLKKLFRAVVGDGLKKNPVESVEQRAANALSLYVHQNKQHRELQGIKFQVSALENIIPLLAMPHLFTLMSYMKHAFTDNRDLIEINEVPDYVNNKLPPEILKRFMKLSADYRLAHEMLGDKANIETKTFMEAYKKTQEVYGPQGVFAAFVATAAVIDVMEAQHELGLDVDLGPDSENQHDAMPKGPTF